MELQVMAGQVVVIGVFMLGLLAMVVKFLVKTGGLVVELVKRKKWDMEWYDYLDLISIVFFLTSFALWLKLVFLTRYCPMLSVMQEPVLASL